MFSKKSLKKFSITSLATLLFTVAAPVIGLAASKLTVEYNPTNGSVTGSVYLKDKVNNITLDVYSKDGSGLLPVTIDTYGQNGVSGDVYWYTFSASNFNLNLSGVTTDVYFSAKDSGTSVSKAVYKSVTGNVYNFGEATVSGGGGGGGAVTPTTPTTGVDVPTTVTTVNGLKVAQAKADENAIARGIAQALASTNKNRVVLNVNATDAGKVDLELDGKAIAKLVNELAQGVVAVQTNLGTYELPVSALKGLAADAKVNVTLTTNQAAVDNAKAKGVNALAAIDFEVTVTAGGSTTTISSFGEYVKRSVNVSKELNSKNAAAVRVDGDTLTPVPATVNGKEISILSRTNSTYMVVENDKTFADVTSHWAKADIEKLANKLIVTGQTSTQFAPERSITRAEFAALVVRGLGLGSNVDKGVTFTDVKKGDWYAGSIGAAVEAGIVNGYGATFKPNQKISRQEMTVMVNRALKFAGKDVTASTSELAKYADATQVQDWAKDSFAVAVKTGIVNGMSSTKLAPNADATRAQSATILKRMLEQANFMN